ncbi:MAG: hypothetical protein NVS9B15_12450 [Acidobacteriaceae bacterium]
MITAECLTISLPSRATDMVQEELRKQVAFLAPGIRNVRFTADGSAVQVEVSDNTDLEKLEEEVRNLASRIHRGLRQLQRKIVFASPRMENPAFAQFESAPGVHGFAPGIVALQGLSLKVFRYFDRVFTEFGDRWERVSLLTPTLIASDVLARCDYFRSFPHNVTFAAHLKEESANIESFRSRYQDVNHLDEHAVLHMETPEACLSPAVCYHTYALNERTTLPAEGMTYAVCGKCFRYESSNMCDLRRLWDFTMREVVFLGSREHVLARRAESIEMMSQFLTEHELAGEIRTASDPFFVAADAVSKTYFQLSSETKFEVSLLLPEGERLAVGSHNYHSDFFGRAFQTTVEGHGAMHSVCVAFGLERWVYAFLQQHGTDIERWPEVMRASPEFSRSRS